MKTLSALLLALAALASAHAQTLRPEAVNGAVLGGIAGAVIGHNSGDLRHNAWRGAAWGAGAGLLLGSFAGENHARYRGTQVPVPDYPRTYVYRRAPGYYGAPVYRTYDGSSYYDYDTGVDYDGYGSGRPDYRGSGLLLGALAGAVIGHNSGDLRHNGWRGAAYGAGLGYLLGSVAEHRARQREAASAPAISSAPAVVDATAAPATPGGQPSVPAPAAKPASSMSAANQLFGRR